ncbi:MAG: ATP-dependent DNA helicase RecG [Rhodobacterales bacterium CG15_BIG_FIL_POST_REV_8_21_14_020_59_13]|nr:MAG: ATP-dependent DNA helicase RecG [Rhodobacterales bacterium CG15_BIG_FIL_POST_REV_8_21_14_020_59_13]
MRPEILFPLFKEVTTLPGLGPKLAALIEKVAGNRVRDLLLFRPTSVIDRSLRRTIDAAPEGQIVTIRCEVECHIEPQKNRFTPYKVRMSDETGFLHLVYFKPRIDYLKRLLPVGETRIVSGRVERFGSEKQITHPDLVLTEAEAEDLGGLETVYPLTQGLSLKILRKAIRSAMQDVPHLPEWHDGSVLHERNWPDWHDALHTLHYPDTVTETEPAHPARQRLAFDELFARQLALQIVAQRRRRRAGQPVIGNNTSVDKVLASAPFKPTTAQLRSFNEISGDMASVRRMMRLLHGDVGSGKTFVAALAAARAHEAGLQTTIMAPTEILARQLARNIEAFLKPAGMTVDALTGRDKGKKRNEILERLSRGQIDVLCGTHALFQEGVTFSNLGLVVIDEQHRFGVSDRLKLSSKGRRPELLVMTATPIPRTLSLSVYGHMDMSRLDEKPAGRRPPDTRTISMDRIDSVIDAIGRAIQRNERVYWVCPLVEESDLSDLSAAEDRYRQLAAIYGEDRVGLVHGRMKARDKDAEAIRFRNGEIDILVATTVIEVGIDAPDATIMIIEHAERFGLAQLHQLRGRVGRSDKASTCLLLYQGPLGELSRKRLDIMKQTDDGFVIAEEDWKLRGAGDPLGVRQSGLPDYRLVDIEAHLDLLPLANEAAKKAVYEDPDFKGKYAGARRTLLYLFEQDEGIRLIESG